MRKSARRNLGALFRLPYLPLWLAPALLLSPVFLTGKAMFWGTPGLQFVPWWNWAWETLQAGHLPLWNPLVGMGAPLLANYQSALFYPPNWSYLFLAAIGGPAALAWGQALLVVIHLSWAGFGTAYLIRKLGLGVLSQTTAGLAFGLSGYLVARAGFLSINSAAAWLPWLLAFGLEIGRRHNPGRVWIVLAFFSGMQLLAGHAQTTAYSLVMVVAWTLFWAWQIPEVPGFQVREDDQDMQDSVRDKFQRMGQSGIRLMAGLAGGFGLAAVQLLPTAEYLIQSQRSAAVDYAFAMTYSFWPWRLLSFFAPDLFGNPVQGDYWGYGAYWEDAVYIGLLPVVMAIGVSFARFWPGRRAEGGDDRGSRASRSLITALLAWLGITLLLALGQNAPIYPWLYRHVAGFDMFQAPTRFMLWAEIGLVILAAYGINRWRRPTGRALYWTRLATAGAVAVAIGAGLTWAFLGAVRPTFIRATALAGFWGVGIGLLSLRAPADGEAKPRSAWTWLVSGFLMLDLLVAGWGLNPGVPVNFYQGPAPSAAEINGQLGRGRLYLGEADEYTLKFNRFLQFSTFFSGEDWINLRAALLPNIHLLDGIRHTANFDPLVPGRYARWLAGLEDGSPEVQERLLNLAAVRVVEITDSTAPYGVRYVEAGGGRRVIWAPCALAVANADEAWEDLKEGRIDLEVEILVEGLDPDQIPDCTQKGSADLQWAYESPNKIMLQIQSDAPGWLMLADTWYPGWEANIDGQATSIYRANYLFRAVQVPPGSHQIAFAYRPFWFYFGLGLSCLSLAVLVVIYARRRD